jgi:hypothetical protein
MPLRSMPQTSLKVIVVFISILLISFGLIYYVQFVMSVVFLKWDKMPNQRYENIQYGVELSLRKNFSRRYDVICRVFINDRFPVGYFHDCGSIAEVSSKKEATQLIQSIQFSANGIHIDLLSKDPTFISKTELENHR